MSTEERIARMHDRGVPSSHIARRLKVPRREVNRVVRDHVMSRGREAAR